LLSCAFVKGYPLNQSDKDKKKKTHKGTQKG
jgi:hypothetical protein